MSARLLNIYVAGLSTHGMNGEQNSRGLNIFKCKPTNIFVRIFEIVGVDVYLDGFSPCFFNTLIQ